MNSPRGARPLAMIDRIRHVWSKHAPVLTDLGTLLLAIQVAVQLTLGPWPLWAQLVPLLAAGFYPAPPFKTSDGSRSNPLGAFLIRAGVIWLGSAIVLRWDPLESTCRHASLSIL